MFGSVGECGPVWSSECSCDMQVVLGCCGFQVVLGQEPVPDTDGKVSWRLQHNFRQSLCVLLLLYILSAAPIAESVVTGVTRPAVAVTAVELAFVSRNCLSFCPADAKVADSVSPMHMGRGYLGDHVELILADRDRILVVQR